MSLRKRYFVENKNKTSEWVPDYAWGWFKNMKVEDSALHFICSCHRHNGTINAKILPTATGLWDTTFKGFFFLRFPIPLVKNIGYKIILYFFYIDLLSVLTFATSISYSFYLLSVLALAISMSHSFFTC